MTAPVAHARCAVWARDAEVDPGGTAPRTDVFVLVEHPLPWPSDIGEDPVLAQVELAATAAAGGRRVRLQAVVGETASPVRRVVVFAAGTEPFTGYGRLEALVEPDRLAATVADLVASPSPPASSTVTDVLICAHGSRDTCCGSRGTRLWLQGVVPHVQVWRTSHTGGHRFAPTAITFPDGNYWARLDGERLAGVVDRSLPPSEAADHLRGCAAFSPTAQVADRAVLAERGWSWLSCARFVVERSERRVELCFESPDGERGGFVVCVEPGREVPVPECGADPVAAAKTQTELHVTHIESWA